MNLPQSNAASLCAVALLAACSASKSAGKDGPATSAGYEVSSLPPGAYLLALDSSLVGERPEYQTTYVQGAIGVPANELRRRHLLVKTDRYVCPAELALWLEPPEQRGDGTVDLEVVKAYGDRGLAGSRVFRFRCSGTTCELLYAMPGNSDRVVLCQRVQRR